MPSLATWGYVAGIAVAQPDWHAPPGCPTQAEVEALLREEHADVPDEVVEASSVDAVVSQLDDGSWQVSVSVETESARVHRVLHLDSCEAAAEATALVYGLALGDAVPTKDAAPPPPEAFVPSPDASDSQLNSQETATEERPAEEAPTPSSDPVPRAGPSPEEDPTAASSYRGAAFVGVGLRAVTLPRLTLAVLAGGEARVGPLRIGAAVDYGFSRRFEVPQTDASGELSTLVGSLSVGVPLEWKALWTPSLAMRAGGILGRGRGGDARRQRWVPWWLLAVGLDASWPPRSRWAVRAGASLEVPLVSHSFTFDTAVLANTAAVGVRAWVGPLVRFGV